jgi:hypothetical protein
MSLITPTANGSSAPLDAVKQDWHPAADIPAAASSPFVKSLRVI